MATEKFEVGDWVQIRDDFTPGHGGVDNEVRGMWGVISGIEDTIFYVRLILGGSWWFLESDLTKLATISPVGESEV